MHGSVISGMAFKQRGAALSNTPAEKQKPVFLSPATAEFLYFDPGIFFVDADFREIRPETVQNETNGERTAYTEVLLKRVHRATFISQTDGS